jgi:hypothetical protein
MNPARLEPTGREGVLFRRLCVASGLVRMKLKDESR